MCDERDAAKRSPEEDKVHFTPKDQIILLAGLDAAAARRAAIWSLPELRARLDRLIDAGLVRGSELTDPAGLAAARKLRHITLDDLLAEHLPASAAAEAKIARKPDRQTSG